ncbi:hypothetical protein D5S17_29040 [Pseudonocardiaceae bacterium YIM PH 21723]|nr:hypothetical protein D5S17_29040 [Pseudonocardiaceae bacterium YIM PH 21723]
MNNRYDTEDQAPDGYKVVAEHFPLDGPYSEDHTRAAATAIAELVRYLNHATQRTTSDAVPYASVAGSVASNLSATLHGMKQLADQIGRHAEQWATEPGIRHDGGEDPAVALYEAVAELKKAGKQSVNLGETFNHAASYLHRIGHDS